MWGRTGAALVWLAPLSAFAHPADDLPQGHWMELSLNTIADVDPCPERDCSYSAVEGLSGAINDWCGGAFATGYGTYGGLVVFGGGHNGYFGSEIYVFDVESQLWTRHTEPYDDGSSSVAAACSDDGVYPDGSACPPHTYDRVDYDPGTNAFVLLFSTTDPVCGGCGSSHAHLFGFDDDAWRLGASHPIPPASTGASSAYDPTRQMFWLLPAYNGHFSAYDPVADAWSVYETYNISIDAVSAVDPVRDLFVTVDGRGTQTVIVHDLADPSAGGVTVNLRGSSPILERGAQGFEWDPVSEQFVGWAGGTEVWTLVPPEGDWRSEAWTWLRVDAAKGNAVTPTEPNGNGTYSRWRHVPSLNVFVVVNAIDEPVYAYRLSADPGVGPNDDDTGGSGGSESGPDETGGSPTSTSTSTSGSGGGGTSSTAGASGGVDTSSQGSSSTASTSESDGSGCGCAAPRKGAREGLALLLVVLAAGRRRRVASIG